MSKLETRAQIRKVILDPTKVVVEVQAARGLGFKV